MFAGFFFFFSHSDSMQRMGQISKIAHHFRFLYIQIIYLQVGGLRKTILATHATLLEVELIPAMPLRPPPPHLQAHHCLSLQLNPPQTHGNFRLCRLPTAGLQGRPTAAHYRQQNTSPKAGTSMQMNLSKDLIM